MDKNILGANIIRYKKIDSTQKEIWRKIEKNSIEDKTVIVADIQTDATGTHGRKWYTPEEGNIAFSFVVYPNVLVKQLENLTIQIAKIIVDIFKEMYGIKLEIKYPNDIVLKGKKIGGILTQTKLKGEMVSVLVIGIGINTNGHYLGDEIKDIATSIKNEFNIEVKNEAIIKQFCKQFEKKILKGLKKL